MWYAVLETLTVNPASNPRVKIFGIQLLQKSVLSIARMLVSVACVEICLWLCSMIAKEIYVLSTVYVLQVSYCASEM